MKDTLSRSELVLFCYVNNIREAFCGRAAWNRSIYSSLGEVFRDNDLARKRWIEFNGQLYLVVKRGAFTVRNRIYQIYKFEGDPLVAAVQRVNAAV